MPHDIFLSYATVDDSDLAQSWAGQPKWVGCFKVALQQAVDRNLGRRSSASWFYDAKDLQMGDKLDEKIKGALDQTKLFVALLSNGYFHPNCWCNLEREHFIGRLGADAAQQRRVLGVLLDEKALEQWKERCFPTVRAFPFYSKDEAIEQAIRLGDAEIDGKFLNGISRLAKEIADRLQELGDEPVQPPVRPAETRGTVYLAVVPGEMEEVRAEIAAALAYAGWKVIPGENECAADPAECAEAAANSLREAEVLAYVQVLGSHAWRPGKYDRVQFESARLVQPAKPILVYRPDSIDLEKVKDADYRAWLAEVPARSLPQIKAEVLEALAKAAAPAPARAQATSDQAAYITLSVAPPECETLGQEVIGTLQQANVYGTICSADGAGLEEIFLSDDGLLTVFGNEPYDRVQQILMSWRKLLAQYRRPPSATPPVGVYLAEPRAADKRRAINMTLPGLRVLEGNDPAALGQFVEAVQKFGASKPVPASCLK